MLTALPKAIFGYMLNDREINALISLLDDPDENIFEVVSNKIIGYGTAILPHLETHWETAQDSDTQQRIEDIIHKLHYTGLLNDFREWSEASHHELLPATLLVAKFLYPDLQTAKTIFDLERLKRNVWLELNNYLTPLEQVNVLINIVFGYFGLKGNPNDTHKPNEFLLPNIIAAKKGNQTGNGVLLLLLCEMLDLPIRYIRVPGQFTLAYFKSSAPEAVYTGHNNIDFFIEPTYGQIFTHHHLHDYLQRIHQPVTPPLFMPSSNTEVIKKLLSDFSECFTGNNLYKKKELQHIVNIL